MKKNILPITALSLVLIGLNMRTGSWEGFYNGLDQAFMIFVFSILVVFIALIKFNFPNFKKVLFSLEFAVFLSLAFFIAPRQINQTLTAHPFLSFGLLVLIIYLSFNLTSKKQILPTRFIYNFKQHFLKLKRSLSNSFPNLERHLLKLNRDLKQLLKKVFPPQWIIGACSKCGQKIRFPNKNLVVTCPKCKHKFRYTL